MSWKVRTRTPRDSANRSVSRNDPHPVFMQDVSRLCQLSFLKIFTEDLSRLYQLSFLLTCDHEKAVGCFIAALEDCINGNTVFSEASRSCAMRAVIQNAILKLKPTPSNPNSPSHANLSYHNHLSSGPGGHFALEAVLSLEDFDRFVLVITVLEDYSPRDCSLFLGCSPSDIPEARTRALEKLAQSVHISSAPKPRMTQGRM